MRLFSSRIAQGAAAVIALLTANVYVCRELFVTPYINRMGSIEGAFIAIARYASQNLGDLTWFPLWYNGIPYQNTYPPVLHLAVAAVIRLTGWDPGLAYHAVTGALYVAGAATVFCFALRLSASIPYSFFAGIAYSFLSSSAFLIPTIRYDLGSVGRPRRLQTLLAYGEGPHVSGLTLLPLAIVCLDAAVKSPHAFWIPLAAIVFAATVLTNWLAAAALGGAVVAYLFSHYSRAAVRRTAAISILAYLFAAPWIPPSTIRVIQFNAQTVGGDYTHVYYTLPLFAAVLMAAMFALGRVTKADGAPQIVRFAAAYSLLMAAIALPAYGLGVQVLPQSERYHLEMEMGLALLLPFLARPFIERLPLRARYAVAAIVLLVVILPARESRRYARLLLAPAEIKHTAEYRVAKWFEANLHGERVLAAGSISFWMNVWTDTPQLGGGFDQGAINFLNRVASYQLYSDDGDPGDHLATSLLWLKAFGVAAVTPAGKQSGEWFHPMRHPEKFGAWELLLRDGGEEVYRVPLRSTSLAHVMPPASLAARRPFNGVDLDPLRTYTAALDNPAYPHSSFTWLNRHTAVINADVKPDQVISVQMTYHPGWRVSEGQTRTDGLGLLVIEPPAPGRRQITLTYDGGMEMKACVALAWLAAALSAWMTACSIRRQLIK